MSNYDILHILDRGFPNGCHEMLRHLYIAIKKYHKNHNQEVILFSNKKINKNRFQIPYRVIDKREISNYIKKKTNPVVIVHRVARSQTYKNEGLFFRKCPYIVLNHSLSKILPHPVGKCDVCVSVAENMRDVYSKKYPKIRHEFIRNGVNQFIFDPIKPRNAYALKGDQFLSGRINAVNIHKHNSSFIKWCSSVVLEKIMLFEYIGDGTNYKQACREANLYRKQFMRNRVFMLGPIYNFEKKISILKCWKAFIYEVNYNEGTSMSVLESLACGVPVLTSNHHGTNEFITKNVNGNVFPKINKIRKYINNITTDDKFFADLSKSTKEHFAKNLDSKISAKKYIELIDDISK